MPELREHYAKIKADLAGKAKEKAIPNKADPSLKYLDLQEFFKNEDVGAIGDEVPEGYILFRAYDVEFIVRSDRIANSGIMYDANMRKRLKEIAERHKSRTMYVCVPPDGRPGVYDHTYEDRIVDKETFHLNGVDIIMEKGAYDRNDPRDIAWLNMVTDRFKRQRIVLFSYNGAPIDECARHGDTGNIAYNPE